LLEFFPRARDAGAQSDTAVIVRCNSRGVRGCDHAGRRGRGSPSLWEATGRRPWGMGSELFVTRIFGLASGGLPLGSPLVLLALADRGRESAHYLMLQ
jgi:hypothetical protein